MAGSFNSVGSIEGVVLKRHVQEVSAHDGCQWSHAKLEEGGGN